MAQERTTVRSCAVFMRVPRGALNLRLRSAVSAERGKLARRYCFHSVFMLYLHKVKLGLCARNPAKAAAGRRSLCDP